VPFCRPGHPLAAAEPQGIKVLREYPVITTEMPRWYTHRWEAELPLDPKLAGELAERGRSVQVPHLGTMVALVTATDSLGMAPLGAISSGVSTGDLVVLGVPAGEQVLVEPAQIVLVTMKGRPLPPSAAAVIAQIRSLAGV
jgi:DNA-binding transcriptional LysR family regulator